MNFDQIIPIIYLIGVLILVLPHFLQSNSKLKQLLANLSIWVIIVLVVTTISYFLLKWKNHPRSQFTVIILWSLFKKSLKDWSFSRYEGAFCRTTSKSLLTENKDFWKLLRRNFVVSFHYLSDFLFWFLAVYLILKECLKGGIK